MLARHVVGTNERNPTMTAKLDVLAAAPSLMKNWMSTSLAVTASLEPTLAELVKIRASQLNGCANCINMHTAEARAKGETEQRIYLLSRGERRLATPTVSVPRLPGRMH
jgi:AhpD family alkylhydroperoxidase